MNLIDSSAWLEYLADGPRAETFEEAISRTQDLLVPVICIYEVFKRVIQQRNEESALRAIALMQQGTVIELDTNIALKAAKRSIEYKLPMADAIILATAQVYKATIWTQDADFKDIKGVKYFSKTSS